MTACRLRFLSSVPLSQVLIACLLVAGPVSGQEPDTAQAEEADLPLPVDRTVRIDMTEGSWMSLDISPDGQRLLTYKDEVGDQSGKREPVVVVNWADELEAKVPRGK